MILGGSLCFRLKHRCAVCGLRKHDCQKIYYRGSPFLYGWYCLEDLAVGEANE